MGRPKKIIKEEPVKKKRGRPSKSKKEEKLVLTKKQTKILIQAQKVVDEFDIVNKIAKSLVENKKKLAENIAVLEKKIPNTFYTNSEDYERARLASNFIHIPDCLTLAYLFQCGGMPIGRILEFGGKQGTFKSTVNILLGACAQAMGFDVWYFDIEHKQDVGYLESLGLDCKPVDDITKDLSLKGSIFTRPKRAEDVATCIRANTSTDIRRVMYIFDSVSALENKWEREHAERDIDKDDGNPKIASFASWLGSFLKNIVGGVSETDSIAGFINQMRVTKKGHMFGLDTMGGEAMKYYESSKFITRPVYIAGKSKFKAKIYDDEDKNKMIWLAVELEMAKSSSGPPIDNQYIFIKLGHGFHKEWELLHLGERYGVIESNNKSHYTLINKDNKLQDYDEEVVLGHGLKKAVSFLEENIKVRNFIEDRLRKKMHLPSRKDIRKDLELWSKVKEKVKELQKA